LFSPTAVPRILEYSPGAKFIVLLRHPVDLAYSFHSHLVYHGDEDVKDFEQAWQLQPEHARGNGSRPVLLFADSCSTQKFLDLAPKWSGAISGLSANCRMLGRRFC
jgi:hypothetical protein